MNYADMIEKLHTKSRQSLCTGQNSLPPPTNVNINQIYASIQDSGPAPAQRPYSRICIWPQSYEIIWDSNPTMGLGLDHRPRFGSAAHVSGLPPPPTALALPPAKPSFSRAGGSRGDKDRPRMHPRRRASTAPRAPPVCTHFLSFVLWINKHISSSKLKM